MLGVVALVAARLLLVSSSSVDQVLPVVDQRLPDALEIRFDPAPENPPAAAARAPVAGTVQSSQNASVSSFIASR